MLRPTLIAALSFAATLGSTDVVAADDCMCALPAWNLESDDLEGWNIEGWETAGGERVPESAEVGPFFSSDGTMLSSRKHLEQAAGPRRHARPSAPVEDVLWCSSPDDPRCSPADPGPEDGPHTGRASHSAGGHGRRDHRIPPALAKTHTLAPRDGPRAGVRSRIERPPKR